MTLLYYVIWLLFRLFYPFWIKENNIIILIYIFNSVPRYLRSSYQTLLFPEVVEVHSVFTFSSFGSTATSPRC